MKTPTELFAIFNELGTSAEKSIVELMKSHAVTSLDTATYMYDYNYDYTDIKVYNRKMNCDFYEPLSSVTLDENDKVHLFYNGEESGECYYPTITDWLYVYSLVYDIFQNVDESRIGLFTTDDNNEE